MSLFQSLELLMKRGDKLQIEINKVGKNKLNVVIIPQIDPTDDELSDELSAIKSNLRSAIFLSGSATELDSTFIEKLTVLSEQRDATQDEFNRLLDTYRESRKLAKHTSAKPIKQKNSSHADPSNTEDSAPAPQSASVESTSVNLFSEN